MITAIKWILIGLLVFFIMGIIGFIAVVAHHVFILNIQDAATIGDVLRSDSFRAWALLFTFVSMTLASWISTRKIDNHTYIAAIILIFLASIIIASGHLRYFIIHNNFLPIIIGGLLGALLARKRNGSIRLNED